MITVLIRNKNQAKALAFLLSNLGKRYVDDIKEIIVIDNCSTDTSHEIASKYDAKFVTLENFSYGGSANFAAQQASNDICVIFSAHSFPVSPNFFSQIRLQFENNANLAGVRCLHSYNDYTNYITGITANADPNKSGLIFSGSAFRKSVWQKIPFNENVPTFEDKDWTKRVLNAGYDIEFAPVVFCYNIRRNAQQGFNRFNNDLYGNYQIWHEEPSIASATKGLLFSNWNAFKHFWTNVYYSLLRYGSTLKFKFKKPSKFEY